MYSASTIRVIFYIYDSIVFEFTPKFFTFRASLFIHKINFILWLYSQNDHKDYFVCGVKLPNSEDFQGILFLFTSKDLV